MKKISGILCVMLAALIAFGASGCGKREKRILYNMELADIVTVGKYEGLKVDTESEEYKEYYDNEIESDVQSNDLYNVVSEGTVFMGDIANIDYEGKKDGEAFDGGTASGYDLTIGSGQFIPGFEEGLVGVGIGTTVNLNLTFPEDYGNELAGQETVFTVTVNSVKRAMATDAISEKLGFKNEKEYLADVAERAAKNCLRDAVFEDTEVSEYPEAEVQLMQPYLMNQIDAAYQQQYGVTLDDYLSYVGQTREQFIKLLNDYELYPLMEQQMTLYFIFDEERLSIPDNAIDEQMDKMLAAKTMSSATKDQLKEYYGEYYFEALAVDEAVMDYVYKNANIK